MEILEFRQRLKDSIRQNSKQSAAALSSQDKRLQYNNFDFFGVSQPMFASRVLQESKSLLENQDLVSKILSSNQSSKKNYASNSAGPKLAQCIQAPGAANELKKKAEKLKVARDYSFLSDDAEVLTSAKEPPPGNVSVPTSEAQSAQMTPRSKHALASNGGRNVQGIREERKSVPSDGEMHKAGSYKSSSASKPKVMSMDSKKQLGVNNGSGTSRPIGVSNGPSRPVSLSTGAGPKSVPSKPIAKMEKMISAQAARNLPSSVHKAPSSKMHSSDPKQLFELKKGSQECSNDKMMPQRPISSKSQVKKPVKQVQSRAHAMSNVQRKQSSEDEEALEMIRNMFKTNRYRVRDNVDDDDDSDMEANFDEIMEEEDRSDKIARKEDAEQLKLIKKEEEQERMRRMAKKRKLSHQ